MHSLLIRIRTIVAADVVHQQQIKRGLAAWREGKRRLLAVVKK